jgi:hypothetical protein
LGYARSATLARLGDRALEAGRGARVHDLRGLAADQRLDVADIAHEAALSWR